MDSFHESARNVPLFAPPLASQTFPPKFPSKSSREFPLATEEEKEEEEEKTIVAMVIKMGRQNYREQTFSRAFEKRFRQAPFPAQLSRMLASFSLLSEPHLPLHYCIIALLQRKLVYLVFIDRFFQSRIPADRCADLCYFFFFFYFYHLQRWLKAVLFLFRVRCAW